MPGCSTDLAVVGGGGGLVAVLLLRHAGGPGEARHPVHRQRLPGEHAHVHVLDGDDEVARRGGHRGHGGAERDQDLRGDGEGWPRLWLDVPTFMVVCAVPAQPAPDILYTDGGGRAGAGVTSRVSRDQPRPCHAPSRAQLGSGGCSRNCGTSGLQ